MLELGRSGAMRLVFVLATVTAVAGCAALKSQGALAPPSPPRQPSLELQFSSFLLGNGLRVVLVKDPNAPEITVTMRYQIGSVDDPSDRPGMAHLVEHLLYAPVVGGGSLFSRLEAATTYFNGATTFDATTFISRAQPARLDELLAIETARLESRCATLTASAFAREREVVVNEIRQRDQASEILGAIYQALYPVNHPYRRIIGGTAESVAAITREQACAFIDAHYAPNNAALVVSGNLTADQEHTVLHRFLAASPRRAVTAPVPIYQVPFQPWYVAAPVPFDDDALLVAWPLPTEPRMRAKVRALVAATVSLIRSEMDGSATTIELGDARAPIIAVVILPATGESLQRARTAMERGIARLPGVVERTDPVALGDFAFTRIRQSALYRLYATLEDSERDADLAGTILAGGDPRTVFGEELAGLSAFSNYEASYIARQMLTLPQSKVVVLQAAAKRKRGSRIALGAPIHDLGQPRHAIDVAEAHRVAASEIAPARTPIWRRLANGLEVVLLPSTSVPTVEMRLVFRTGSADEPPDKRGVARLAADALAWDLRFGRELLLFASAGGGRIVDVGTDATTFTAHGVDMYLDLLLTGLRTWVREGRYDDSIAKTLATIARERVRRDDDAAYTDAWRAALFGQGHPYARAGVSRYANPALTAADAIAFRAAHFTPDNATLVIAGRFDPVLADRWIDYLFADWRGRAQPRVAPRVTSPAAIAIAKFEELAQVQLRIAIPATAGGRAEQLVVAEMLAGIASEVRHQLGASYDLTAGLGEQRLASVYGLGGWIDATRAAAAIQLLRDRIAKLRSDPDGTARAFVRARNRVALLLGSTSGSAASLAARIERDVTLGHPPLNDVRVAREVSALTIERMAAALRDIDLARASIALRGPAADLARAFAALGKKPVVIR